MTVDYEPLPAARRRRRALAPGAPRVFEAWPDNVVSASPPPAKGDARPRVRRRRRGRGGAPRLSARVHGVPIETRGVVATPAGRPTAASRCGRRARCPYAVRSGIAPARSGCRRSACASWCPTWAAASGSRATPTPRRSWSPAVARRLGRPVKWAETRREHFLTAAADRDQLHEARIGLGARRPHRGHRDHVHARSRRLAHARRGHHPQHHQPPARALSRAELSRRSAGTSSPTRPSRAAYRGAGRPEAAFVLDRLLDRAARRIGMDPAELRRRNLIRADEMPSATGLTYRDGAPITYDPADYPAAFERLLAGSRLRRLARRAGRSGAGARGRSAWGSAPTCEGTGIGPVRGRRHARGSGRHRVRAPRRLRPGPGARDHAGPDRGRRARGGRSSVVVVGRRHQRWPATAWARSRAAWPR